MKPVLSNLTENEGGSVNLIENEGGAVQFIRKRSRIDNEAGSVKFDRKRITHSSPTPYVPIYLPVLTNTNYQYTCRCLPIHTNAVSVVNE
jgi:hypothetical protein